MNLVYQFQVVSPEEDERPSIVESQLNCEQNQRYAGRAIKGFSSVTPYQVRSIAHRQVEKSPNNREHPIWWAPIRFLDIFLS